MSGLLEMLGQQLSPGMINQISSQVGANSSTTQSAVAAALPALFGAMAQHASGDAGAGEIHQAVQSAPADGTVPAASPSLVSSILGPHQSDVQSSVAQASGLNTQQAGKVLLYLAPIAVAILARKHSEDPQAVQQPGGLAALLRSAQQQVQPAAQAGGLGGLLGNLFG